MKSAQYIVLLLGAVSVGAGLFCLRPMYGGLYAICGALLFGIYAQYCEYKRTGAKALIWPTAGIFDKLNTRELRVLIFGLCALISPLVGMLVSVLIKEIST